MAPGTILWVGGTLARRGQQEPPGLNCYWGELDYRKDREWDTEGKHPLLEKTG